MKRVYYEAQSGWRNFHLIDRSAYFDKNHGCYEVDGKNPDGLFGYHWECRGYYSGTIEKAVRDWRMHG